MCIRVDIIDVQYYSFIIQYSAGSEYLSGSDFGANYYLPIVRVYCYRYRSSGYSNISQCDIDTDLPGESYNCNHGNEIGLICQGIY